MATEDNLSGAQFMHVRRLMKMPSVEGDYTESGGPVRVGDVLRSGQRNTGDPNEDGLSKFEANNVRAKKNPSYWSKLDSAIRNRSVDPIHIGRGADMFDEYDTPGDTNRYANRLVLGNGHHRVARALQLGQSWLPVTFDEEESGRD